MELNYEEYVLPKRTTQNSVHLKGTAQIFITNYYTVKFNKKAEYLYQYSLDSEVISDNTGLVDRLV
jgi:hypothetical protein